MVRLSVCVGSSCHLKGAPDIIAEFQKLIAEHEVWNKIELKGVFCLENCRNGVSVKVNDNMYGVRDTESAKKLFEEKILTEIGG